MTFQVGDLVKWSHRGLKVGRVVGIVPANIDIKTYLNRREVHLSLYEVRDISQDAKPRSEVSYLVARPTLTGKPVLSWPTEELKSATEEEYENYRRSDEFLTGRIFGIRATYGDRQAQQRILKQLGMSWGEFLRTLLRAYDDYFASSKAREMPLIVIDDPRVEAALDPTAPYWQDESCDTLTEIVRLLTGEGYQEWVAEYERKTGRGWPPCKQE